jgi:hypothetical protein
MFAEIARFNSRLPDARMDFRKQDRERRNIPFKGFELNDGI